MNADVQELLNRCKKYLTENRPAAAEALLAPYLATGSGPVPLWRGMVLALRQQNRMQEACRIQTMLVDTMPGDFAARYDLAETLLSLGEFDRGWREYRYRYSLAHTQRIERKVQRPRWAGEPIPGRVLLIHDEQGFGDTFQFIRLVHRAKSQSQARIILEVHPEAYALAGRSFPGVSVIRRGELPPPFDLHCEMMSLPMALGLQLADLPGPVPYLAPDPVRVEFWRQRLSKLSRPLVALAWAGRAAHPNDANRSASLQMLAPLAASAVQFVSIQKGPAAAEAMSSPAGMKLLALGDEIRDFDDTAAILCNTDLLVSVDSSPVHLAGALGRVGWVMLPYVAEWRWLQNRNDTPWYPKHLLFRQPCAGDWCTVSTDIAAALRGRIDA